MSINGPRADLLDSLIELAGIKSGLVLTRDDVIRLLEQESDGASRDRPGPWWRGDLGDWVRIRAEALEADYIHLLYALGVLPDSRTPFDLLIDYRRENDADFGDLEDLPPALAEEVERRSLLNGALPATRTWDTAIPLADLFTSEEMPQGATPDTHFDQRYIDYLNAQAGDLHKIHWRQFELLTAEFFRRNGYEVEVTPPRGDGGFDVVAKREGDVGPELIIVQCKRYGPENTVEIDEVKAFWTVIGDAGATRGLIATTSHLEKGANEYCSARNYRLTAAEGDQVEEWLASLASKTAASNESAGA